MATAVLAMAPAALPEWNPTTDPDRKLKASLQSLTSSTDPVMLTPIPKAQATQDNKQQAKFLLQGKAYFDLKSYVITGKDFPVSDAAFDQLITKDAFKRLLAHEGIDQDIYTRTKATCVGIGSTCLALYDNHLYRIRQAGQAAKSWTQSTLEILNVADDKITLRSQLMVLCDVKYKTPADEDAVYAAAKSGADTSLQMLQMTAEEAKEQAVQIVAALLKFRDETRPLASSLEDLIIKYSTTPVKYDDGREIKGYLTFLDADYHDSLQKFQDTLSKYNSTYADWQTATGTAVGIGVTFGWIPPFGWAALAAASHIADNLHKAWEKLWEQSQQLDKDNQDEYRLILFVTKLVGQFRDIDSVIQGAIDAVSTLCDVFQTQADSYEGIRSTLGRLKIGAASSDAGNRKGFIDICLGKLVEKLEALNRASVGFMEAIDKEDKTMFRKQ